MEYLQQHEIASLDKFINSFHERHILNVCISGMIAAFSELT